MIGLFHAAILAEVADHTTMINKITGTVLQVIGGVVVLLAIDGNLGLFREQSLRAVVLGWFRDFPRRIKSITIQLKGMEVVATAGSPTLSLRKAAITVEERLAELERRIEEIHGNVQETASVLHLRVDAVRAELGTAVASNSVALRQLASNPRSSAQQSAASSSKSSACYLQSTALS